MSNTVREFFNKLRSIKMPNGQWYKVDPLKSGGVHLFRGMHGKAITVVYLHKEELQTRWKLENDQLYWRRYISKGYTGYDRETWHKAEFKLL